MQERLKKLQLAEWRKKEGKEERDRGKKGKREKEGGEGGKEKEKIDSVLGFLLRR